MLTPSSKPIIFLAFANDRAQRGDYLRNLGSEADSLRSSLQQAAALGEVVERHSVTPEQILQVFQQYGSRVAIFHYAGHADDYTLLLEAGAGGRVLADGRGLAAFLQQQRGLQLVFLNACSTRVQADDLRAVGVPIVIATSRAIDDELAAGFATTFYQSLAGGDTLASAFNKAKAAVQFRHGDLSRHLRPHDQPGQEHTAQGLPWELYTRPGATLALEWSLPAAAGNPLWNLPALPAMDLPAKPFRDLSWFRRADAPIFFGRGQQIRQLYTTVTDAQTAPLVLFYGQSGVGKSSLLDAGLLPRLEQTHQVRYARREQEQGLLGTLVNNLPGISADFKNVLAAWRAAEQAANQPLTLILDQVEEHFTRPNPALTDEIAQFLAALTTVFADRSQRPQGKLILSFRKEWLAEIEKRLGEFELPFSKVFLERLDEAGVIEAVSGVARTPALQQHYGLTIDDELAAEIANDLLKDRAAPVAPMLQILLTRLWEEATQRNRAHPHFDQTLYDQLRRGGLKLKEFLDRQLARLQAQQPEVVDSGLALDLLSFHTTPLGTAEQRDQGALQQAYRHRAAILPDLVRNCQNLYLLVDPAADQANSLQQSRLAHDTLAPLVRARFDESDLPGQRARRVLEARAVDWTDGKTGTPLDQADLALVESGQSGMRTWREEETRLLEVSRAEQQRQGAERAALARKQEEDRQRQLAMAQEMAQSESARAQAQTLAATRLRWMLLASIGLVVAMFAAIGILVRPTIQEQWAIRQARGELVTIPAGTAVIGTDIITADIGEQPQWNVSVPAVKIEKYEVSNYQYRLCVEHRGCSETTNPTEIYDDTRAEYPVGYLTALQAAAYCGWIGRRLPTEIEWEYVARGTEGRTWPWGNEGPTDNSGCPGPTEACPVNSYAAGATPEHVYHLWGNLWEWTSSYAQENYTSYNVSLKWDGRSATLVDDPQLILRGGSYQMQLPSSITYRNSATAYRAARDYGVRCVEE